MIVVIAGPTLINGKEAPWTPAILKEFEESVQNFAEREEMTNRTTIPVQITVERPNYFEPRPYRNEYDRGSDRRGFTWTVRWPGWANRDVVQTVLEGRGSEEGRRSE